MTADAGQRLATWILTRCTPEYTRDALIGDLLEQYEERGNWWYWRQALGAVRSHTVRRLLAATENHVPAAEYISDLAMWIALGLFCLIQLQVYAQLFISWTPLIRSESSISVVSALIGVCLIGAATTAHEIRKRTSLAR